MSASQELTSIADSLAVLGRSSEMVSLNGDELAGLAYALRDLSVRVGYLEKRGADGGRSLRQEPLPPEGATVIPFPSSQEEFDERTDTAA